MAQLCFWIGLLCLQACLEAVESDTASLLVNGILGEAVTFPLNLQKLEEIENIAWNSKTSIAFVVPGRSGEAPQVNVAHQNYLNRINVSPQNYNLQISPLRMEDAGTYRANINRNVPGRGLTTTTKTYELDVYRRIEKPKITQSLMTTVNGTCNVTLTCSVEKAERNVTYSWSPLEGHGSVLQVFQTPEHGELTYTCTARNPISNHSSSISAQQLCTDVAPGLRPRHAGLLGGLAVLSLLVLVLPPLLLFLLCKRERGPYLNTFLKKPGADAAQKNTIYTYVTVPKGTQPEEARVYDEILTSKALPPKDKPVNTIYSTVQSSEMEKPSPLDSRPPAALSYEHVI